MTVIEHRRCLALLERSGKSSEEMRSPGMVRDAEASGSNRCRYAERLRGYALAPPERPPPSG
jgi:hypothetical protein